MPDRFGPFLDVKAATLVAAFFGAVAAAIVLRQRSALQIVGTVFVGMLTAVYLGPLIGHWLVNIGGFEGLSDHRIENAASFVAGLTGMALCNGIMGVARAAMGRVGASASGGRNES